MISAGRFIIIGLASQFAFQPVRAETKENPATQLQDFSLCRGAHHPKCFRVIPGPNGGSLILRFESAEAIKEVPFSAQEAESLRKLHSTFQSNLGNGAPKGASEPLICASPVQIRVNGNDHLAFCATPLRGETKKALASLLDFLTTTLAKASRP